MHYKGIVDQDIHLGNLLVSLDSKRWVKVDLGNAAWCLEQTPEQEPTKIFFPMWVTGSCCCVLLCNCEVFSCSLCNCSES